MTAVPSMQEEMNQGARQENEVGEDAQKMGAMFRPKKEPRDHQ
jgi:hypothetical protein